MRKVLLNVVLCLSILFSFYQEPLAVKASDESGYLKEIDFSLYNNYLEVAKRNMKYGIMKGGTNSKKNKEKGE